MATITVSSSNTTVDEGVVTLSTVNITGSNDTVTLDPGSTNDTVAITGSNDTLTANGLSHSTITAGNGTDPTVTANGDSNSITVGDGSNTINAGSHASITIGNGINVVTAGANSTIGPGAHRDDGNDKVTAGPSSTITLGTGNDLVFAGASSTITVGNGTDTIHAGTTDNITIGHGADVILYDGLTPQFTVPASLSVNEEGSIALPITLSPPSLGNEVISGFRTNQDEIELDTADFPNFAAVQANTKQVGANTVITQPGGGGTITLQNVSAPSLSASNFTFFSGTGNDQITITGVPADETLSAGQKNADGSWTLTVAQLSGLTLNAGEPIGFPNPVNLGVTITNPAGQGASASQNVPLVVNPLPPTVHVSVLAPQAGDPVTETRLSITATADDFPADGASDFINRIALSGLPAGVTLSTGNTITPGSQQGTFTTEVDVFAPAGQSTNFDLGVKAFADEPNSPETSASTSQNIDIEYTTVSQTPDFMANNQSIWATGNAPGFSFNKFLGVNTHKAGHLTIGSTSSIPIFSNNLKLGGSVSLKAGFQADLSVNSGSFNATLPFDVTLASTDNKTNNTLEILPTDTQAADGTISTTSPNGSFALDFIFDAMASVFAGAHVLGIGGTGSLTVGPFNLDIPIVSFSSAKNTVNGIPVAFTVQIPISEDNSITATFQWPSVSTNGTGAAVTGPHTISSSGTSNPVFSLTVDPIAIAFAAFGLPDPFSVKIAGINVSLLSASVGAGLDFTQAFNLNASGLTTPGQASPELTLGNGAGTTTVPFSFGTPVIIQDASSHGTNPDGSIPVALGLTPDATLENKTGLVPALEFGINLLSASIDHLQLGPLFSLSTNIPIHGLNLTFYDSTFPVSFSSTNIKTSVA
jgi:hypothetical protein